MGKCCLCGVDGAGEADGDFFLICWGCRKGIEELTEMGQIVIKRNGR